MGGSYYLNKVAGKPSWKGWRLSSDLHKVREQTMWWRAWQAEDTANANTRNWNDLRMFKAQRGGHWSWSRVDLRKGIQVPGRGVVTDNVRALGQGEEFILIVFKYVITWLFWVLVAALGIFNLHCGRQDLYLLHVNSCSMWDLVPRPGTKPGSMES